MSSKIRQSATFSTKGTVTKKENDREQSSVVLYDEPCAYLAPEQTGMRYTGSSFPKIQNFRNHS